MTRYRIADTTDEGLRDWLQQLRRFAGPDCDRATALLDLLDGVKDSEDLLADYGERVGDIDDAQKQVETLAKVTEWASHDPTFKEFGMIDEETLERFARAFDKLETQAFELQALCVEAGLLNANDHVTNPVPLLRMFLPV